MKNTPKIIYKKADNISQQDHQENMKENKLK